MIVRAVDLAGRVLTIAITSDSGAVTRRGVELDSDHGRMFFSADLAQREPIDADLEELLGSDAIQLAIDALDAANAADDLADYQACHGRRRAGGRW